MYSIIFLAIVSCALSLVLSPFVRDIFRALGLVDTPSERKVHVHPVPRVGGIAIFLAFILAYATLLLVRLKAGYIIHNAVPDALRLFPAIGIIFATGLLDDIIGLRPWQKLGGQLVAAGVAWAAGVHILGFGGHVLPIWINVPLTVIWLLGCTNAFNLIDGVDGLAAGVGLFATLTMLVAALLQQNLSLALATVPLAGALVGFLRYNFNPATIFLGDCGSLLIGFLLGCYGILWSQKSATILGMTAPLMALAIPLLDTALAIVRRFLRHKPIFGADRGHIHHRLLDRGLTPRKVALLLYGFGALSAICSLAVMNNTYSGLVLVLFCIVTWAGIQHLGYVEFGTASRMFLGGAFRRQLTGQLAVAGLFDDLSSAATVEECWEVIRDSSVEFGFHQVRLCLAGRMFEHGCLPEPTDGWVMQIPLSESDYVELSRGFELAGYSAAVAAFADTIKKALGPRVSSFAAAAPGRKRTTSFPAATIASD